MEQDNDNFNQCGSTTLSTRNTLMAHPQFHTQQSISRNSDLPIPPDCPTHTSPHDSPQPGPSTFSITNTNIQIT